MADSRPILIVDDEPDLRDLLELNLLREGFRVVTAGDGAEALKAAAAHRPSLIVLDLMLPDVSGTELCRRFRSDASLVDTPIIMLTAKGEEIDRVVGFEVGADDYVVKSSFSIREFILRVRAVLRRRQHVTSRAPTLSYGTLEIDEAAHRVRVAGVEVELTRTEFKLLHTLAAQPGRVLTRGQLLEDVWNMPGDIATRTVDTHVKRLREKLGEAGKRGIKTVRGVGYRFQDNS